MAQNFDKSRGCLPVTPYLILVTEDTTVTVGEGACTVTITAAEGQRVVWTDSAAKLTLSTDSARYEQLPKSAPLPIGSTGQGGSPLSPEAQAFLEFVTDGKLTFGSDGRLKIATSVDATGTFNHDGYASNYTKTVDGAKYTTTVNATEVIVRKSVAGVETVLMHLHDGELELGTSRARVLTEAGERVLTADVSGTTANVTMQHATVVEVPSAVTAVSVTPNIVAGFAKQTHLVLTPADTMPSGWLSATGGAVVRWAFGEIAMPAGWSYIVTLVQVGNVILANALPVDLSPPAA